MLTIEQKRIKIKELLEEANSQFVSVEFIKKDDSVRQMTINPQAMKNHLVESYKSTSTEQAVKTRKENNPNLINVWELTRDDDNKPVGQPRSINMDTVTKIVSNGVTYEFKTAEKKSRSKGA